MAPTPGRAVVASLLLVGGFLCFLTAAVFGLLGLMVAVGDSDTKGLGHLLVAAVAAVVSWMLHRTGLRRWRRLDLSPRALIGAETEIEEVWISRPGRTLVASWLVMCAGIFTIGLSGLLVLSQFVPLSTREQAALPGMAVFVFFSGILFLRAGIGSLRNPTDRDLRLLASSLGVGAGFVVYYLFTWPDARVLRFGCVIGGIAAYSVTFASLRRREDYACLHPIALGSFAIWLAVMVTTHLLALGIKSFGLDIAYADLLAAPLGVGLYAWSVRRIGEAESVDGEFLLVAGCLSAYGGIQLLIRVLDSGWLLARSWSLTLMILMSGAFYYLLEWLRHRDRKRPRDD